MTGEYPIIRYYNPNENDGYFHASILPTMIAQEFQTQLDDYARGHSDFPPPSTRQRSVFIITDRTMDLFAPLLHEFTYQAMAHDNVRTIKDDVYTYEAETERGDMETKTAKLDDCDSEWCSLRHLHIMDAKQLFSTRLDEFLSRNDKFVDRSKIKSTSDILTAVAHMQGFDEERRIMTLHKTLIEYLLLINGEKKLAELAEFEQNLANFGVNIDGEREKNLADRLVMILVQERYNFPDKLRAILIYGLYRGGLIEEDYIKLFQLIGFSSPSDIENKLLYIRNFGQIGFKLIKPSLKSKSVFKRDFLHESISENSYNTSRFRPAIDSVVTRVIQNSLPDQLFPYVKDKPLDESSDISRTNSTSTTSLRNPKHKPAWARTNSAYQAPRQRIFYFIAGGMTHSEMRTAYELSSKWEKDVIIGSDEVLTPYSFIQQVHNLSVPRENLHLLIDWKLSRPTEPPRYLLENEKKQVQQAVQQQYQPSRQTPSPANLTESPTKGGKRERFKKFLRK
jgi:syntaxin-binding protein 1